MSSPKNVIDASEQGGEKKNEEGYDSDGHQGPFIDAVVIEGAQELDEDDLPELEQPGAEVKLPTEESSKNEGGAIFVNIDKDELDQMNVLALKEELRKRGKPVYGKKAALYARLKDALDQKVCLVQEGNAGKKKKQTEDVLRGFPQTATWQNLSPEESIVVEPRNPYKLYAPTVPAEEAEHVPKKYNFAARFQRPVFEGTMEISVLDDSGQPLKNTDGTTAIQKILRTNGCVKESFIQKNGLTAESTPQEWFRAFLPDRKFVDTDGNKRSGLIQEWCSFTNRKAMLCNAGNPGCVYPDFKEFTPREIEKHIALYFLNGLSPSPQAEMKFKSVLVDPVNGNDLCFRVFGPNAIRRHKHFKAFFCMTDPAKATPPRKTNPNYKVDSFNQHIMDVSLSAWAPGQNLSCDEQTVGFQGKHKDKKRINYKAEGDGFQCNAICDRGYTLAFHFRNAPAPQKYVKQGLSPLHSRVMGLYDVLGCKYHRVWFDNLYLSARFVRASFLHKNKVLIAGVTRKNGRGLPNSVKQEEVTIRSKQIAARGTVKAAVLKGDPDCNDMVALSVYDTKPVHFLSMICENIKWVEKERTVYCVDTGRQEKMKYLRLNVNDDYNCDMGSVDISDQLRNVYRFDHWMRKRKWWWSIWFWGLGVLQTNAYLCYKNFMIQKGFDKKVLSHFEFLRAIALAWLDPATYWKTKFESQGSLKKNASSSTKRKHQTIQREISSIKPEPKRLRCSRVTDVSLEPKSGNLNKRLNHSMPHWPFKPTIKDPGCALHLWATAKKYRCGIVYCSICNVHLCVGCFHRFHTCEDLVGRKDELSRELGNSD